MDKRSITSAINGQLYGGRKKGLASIEAEKARNLIAEKLQKYFAPIVDKAIEQALEGNTEARNWLTERGYGKLATPLTTQDSDGNEIPMPIYNGLSIHIDATQDQVKKIKAKVIDVPTHEITQ